MAGVRDRDLVPSSPVPVTSTLTADRRAAAGIYVEVVPAIGMSFRTMSLRRSRPNVPSLLAGSAHTATTARQYVQVVSAVRMAFGTLRPTPTGTGRPRDVHRLDYGVQMVRVDTRTDEAEVIKLKTFRDRPDQPFIRQAMSLYERLTHPYPAVAVSESSRPEPAKPGELDLFPESSFQLREELALDRIRRVVESWSSVMHEFLLSVQVGLRGQPPRTAGPASMTATVVGGK